MKPNVHRVDEPLRGAVYMPLSSGSEVLSFAWW